MRPGHRPQLRDVFFGSLSSLPSHHCTSAAARSLGPFAPGLSASPRSRSRDGLNQMIAFGSGVRRYSARPSSLPPAQRRRRFATFADSDPSSISTAQRAWSGCLRASWCGSRVLTSQSSGRRRAVWPRTGCGMLAGATASCYAIVGPLRCNCLRRTTVPRTSGLRPSELLARDFTASAPNRRWVVGFRHVATAKSRVPEIAGLAHIS